MEDLEILSKAIDAAILRGVFNRQDIIVLHNSLINLELKLKKDDEVLRGEVSDKK